VENEDNILKNDGNQTVWSLYGEKKRNFSKYFLLFPTEESRKCKW